MAAARARLARRGRTRRSRVGVAVVNAAARDSRTSRAWLSRFSTLIRLSDPERQAVADDQVGPLVVDVDLQRPGVAGDEDGLADRLEVVADRVDVERAPRRSAWSRNIVS